MAAHPVKNTNNILNLTKKNIPVVTINTLYLDHSDSVTDGASSSNHNGWELRQGGHCALSAW